MSTPYRDAPPAEDNEPIPDLSVNRDLWPTVRFIAAIVAACALAERDDIDKATVIIVMGAPVITFYVLLATLRRPVGAWLAARHERVVAEGVAALESKVSARE